jgi:hypothetical protein
VGENHVEVADEVAGQMFWLRLSGHDFLVGHLIRTKARWDIPCALFFSC